jgi:hypothetical protein
MTGDPKSARIKKRLRAERIALRRLERILTSDGGLRMRAPRGAPNWSTSARVRLLVAKLNASDDD